MKSRYSHGSILILALILLLLMELMALAVVSSVNITSHVLRNHKKAQAIYREADNLTNYVMGNKDFFINYSHYTNAEGEFEIAIPDFVVTTPRTGRIAQFICASCQKPDVSIDPANKSLALDQSLWVLRVEVTDPQIGSVVTLGQGLRIVSVADRKAQALQSSSGQTGDDGQFQIWGTWWYSQSLAINRIALR